MGIAWPFVNLTLPPDLSSFTLCHAYYTWRLEYGVVALGTSSGLWWLFVQHWYPNRWLSKSGQPGQNNFTREIWVKAFQEWKRVATVQFEIPVWDYFCYRVDLLKGEVGVTMNGVVVAENVFVPALKQEAAKIRDIMAFVHLRLVKFDKATKVDIFTGVIGNESCTASQNGDLLSWSPDTWSRDRYAIVEKIVDSDICPPARPYLLYVLEEMEVYTAIKICENIGRGRLPVPRDRQDWLTMDEKHRFYWRRKEFWFPYVRSAKGDNRTFVNYYTGEPVDDIDWAPSHPMGHDCCFCSTHCYSEQCSLLNAFMCEFDEPPLLVLQGLCPVSQLDQYYYPLARNNTIHWIGLSQTYIKFNSRTNR